MKLRQLHIIILSSICVIVSSCKKEETVPDNPYENIDYGDDQAVIDTLDKNGLTSIHRDIFQPKCATPGCHDGSFEPDFRTVQSTYSSTVYQPIIKNNAALEFDFRIVPFSTSKSVLFERITNCCFVNTNDRMPQDNIGDPLPDDDISRIEKWIENGAENTDNNISQLGNLSPTLNWYVANKDDWSHNYGANENRVDSEWHNPFMITDSDTVKIFTNVEDDSTSVNQLINNRFVFSYDKDDFSSSFLTINAGYSSNRWVIYLKGSDFIKNTTIYFRFYTNDGDHAVDQEYPKDTSPWWVKGNWSFIVN